MKFTVFYKGESITWEDGEITGDEWIVDRILDLGSYYDEKKKRISIGLETFEGPFLKDPDSFVALVAELAWPGIFDAIEGDVPPRWVEEEGMIY